MSSKELILIVLAIIVAGCIIAGAIFLTADTESVPVNNITAVNNTTNITENITEEINNVKEDTPKKTSSNYDPVNYDMIDTDGDGIGDSPGQYYGSTQSEIDQYEADIQREQALYG